MILLFACASPEPGPAGDDSTPVVDDPAEITVTAELSEEVVTVVRVSWTSTGDPTGHVEFGEGDWEYTTPASTGEALLLGMPADTDVQFRVVLDDGSTSDTETIRTGPLPSELPSFTLAGEVISWVGEFMVAPIQGTRNAVIIIDDQGRIVWYDVVENGYNMMKALAANDRQSVVYCLAGPQDALDRGIVARVSMDGTEETLTPFPYMDHDMVELPDGTIGAIVVTEHENADNLGDTIVELAPDGTMTEIWSAWEEEELRPHYREELHNWSHANALEYDAAADTYYISLKELGSIGKIDRATGESQYWLNGVANQFTAIGDTEVVMMQHQFDVLPDGNFLIFDNGLMERGYSRAAEFVVDDEAMTVEQVWEYIREPSVAVYSKGDVRRFDDGNTQVVWSTSGEIQNVTPEGEVLWQLNTDLGYVMTFVQHVPSLYVAG